MTHDKPHVTAHMLAVIEAVGRNVSQPRHLEPLRHQVDEVLDALDDSDLRSTDREAVRLRARQVLHNMETAHNRVAGEVAETHHDG